MLKRTYLLLLMLAATSVMPLARAIAQQFFNTSLQVKAPVAKPKIKGKTGTTPFFVYNNPEKTAIYNNLLGNN